MTITSNDISFVYSGGQNNIDPSKSIGGIPSNNIIEGELNNLFSNLRKEESEAGLVDYRCFYMFNNSSTDALYNASVCMQNQISGVGDCQIGINKSTHKQVLSLNIGAISGSFSLKYENAYETIPIAWNDNYLVFQQNIQDALNNLDPLSGVFVQKTSENVFIISFLEKDNDRNHEKLVVINNNLVPSITISVETMAEGQPINSIASLLPTRFTTPYGTTFYNTNSSSKIILGNLYPGDGVPIWIKRSSLGTVSNDQLNGFSLRLSGNLNENPTVITSLQKPCFYYE